MNKVVTMFVTALISMLSSQICAQGFYHFRDTAFAVSLSKERIAIQLDTTGTTTDLSEFLNSHPCLNASAEVESLGRGFFSVALQSQCDYEAASIDLQNDSIVSRFVPVYVALSYSTELKVSDRVSIRFHPGLRPDSMFAILAANGLHLLDSSRYAPGMWWCALDDTAKGEPLEYANRLHALDAVWWASPTFFARIYPASNPTDPYFAYQYYLNNTGQTGGTADVDIDADSAWMVPLVDSSLRVAIIDYGIEVHTDLPSGRKLPGYDFIGDEYITPFGPRPDPDDDPSPGLVQGHGMACAGILAASHNGTGVAGVIGSCQVIPIKIFDNDGISPEFHPEVVAEAIRYASTQGGRVISNSWTYVQEDWDPDVADAIVDVVDKCVGQKSGVPACTASVAVFAAGNSADNGFEPVNFPANMPQTIAVGAVNAMGAKWDYSCFGSALDVMAPSGDDGDLNCVTGRGDMWTMDRMGGFGWNPLWPDCHPEPADDWDYTANMGGTSGACPQVAGIAALVLARRTDFFSDPQLRDTLPRVVKYIIDSSAIDLEDPGRDDLTGYGRANAYRALYSVIRGDMDNDGYLTNQDLSWMIDYLFIGGPPALLGEGIVDIVCDGTGDCLDMGALIDILYSGAPQPRPCFNFW